MGVKYRFASQSNLDKFKANPARYEPAHGGWCSWAMREGDKVDVDPTSFIVKDDRLFLFYKGWLGNTRAKWLKGDHAAEAKDADANWKKLSKEEPRMVPPAMTGAAKETPVSLQSKLDAIWAGYETKLPADRIAGIEGGIKQVADAGVPAGALKVGAQAPEFELTDAKGKSVSLKSMLAQGPVVLTWYRGNWCPFCVAQLKDYQQSLAQFKAMNASVVALSPQTVERSRELVEKSGIGFTVLSDPLSNVARSYGLAYKVPGSMRGDLSSFNGADNGELPLAATYVLDRSGKVVYAFATADFRKRAEPQEIISAVRAIKP
jgi:peroxiredoxin